jgi:hypothetical protein
MADPRATLDFVGQHAKFMTFTVDASTINYSATAVNGSAEVGLAVTFTTAGDGTIKLTEDGEFVLGRLCNVTSDGFATVQIAGVMLLPSGAGATITEGTAIVGDLDTAAKGYIRSAASGTAGELILCRGFIIEDAEDSDGYLAVYL